MHRTLIRQYLAQGRRDTALRQYQVCVEAQRRELGVEPDADTMTLYREALRTRAAGPAAASRRRPPDGEREARDEPALVGRDAELARLRQAVDLAADGVRGDVLVRRRVLGVAGERFDFVHDRVREVAYDGLLPARRRLLHREVAEALEALHAPAPPIAVLGRHYRMAEVWPKAVTCLQRAGALAMQQSSFREAVTCYTQAIEALERLPATFRV